MRKNNIRRRAFAAAFPNTIPIFASFWFLGLAYGIYMNTSGFSFWYPAIMSLTIFGGSLEFVAVSMLLSPFAPVTALLLSLMMQARHLFYGIAMLDKYKNLGWKKYYLIFGLCDETFSINCTANIPEGVDRGWFYFFVTLLNHAYWFTGATIGGIAGTFLSFDTKGLGFVMTSMFVVIFIEQWFKEKKHITAFIGIGAAIVCRLIFGEAGFMVPTMISILLMITLLRKPIERSGGYL